MATGPELRIGDAEREAAAASLREHYAQGRLTLEEFNERLDAMFKSITQGQLNHITQDLPHVPAPAPSLPVTRPGPAGSGPARLVPGSRPPPTARPVPRDHRCSGHLAADLRPAPADVPVAGQAGHLPGDLGRRPRAAAPRVRAGPARRPGSRALPGRLVAPRFLIGGPDSAGRLVAS